MAEFNYQPAKIPTFYYIGVTTRKFSITRVFPAWAEHLGLGGTPFIGIDCKIHDDPEVYRKIIKFLKEDDHSLGALVTSHKLDLFSAAREFFDEVDSYAELLGETSCISKQGKKLWAPAIDEAIKRGAPSNQLITAYSNNSIKITNKIEIIPIPSAHEELQIDEKGDYIFLGYIFKFGDLVMYHSGDCVPYDGLIDLLLRYKIDIAFLPLNGRDKSRRSNNIAGNFHISEVLDICKTAKIPHLVVHHFGMFAYNTVTEEKLEQITKHANSRLRNHYTKDLSEIFSIIYVTPIIIRLRLDK